MNQLWSEVYESSAGISGWIKIKKKKKSVFRITVIFFFFFYLRKWESRVYVGENWDWGGGCWWIHVKRPSNRETKEEVVSELFSYFLYLKHFWQLFLFFSVDLFKYLIDYLSKVFILPTTNFLIHLFWVLAISDF